MSTITRYQFRNAGLTTLLALMGIQLLGNSDDVHNKGTVLVLIFGALFMMLNLFYRLALSDGMKSLPRRIVIFALPSAIAFSFFTLVIGNSGLKFICYSMVLINLILSLISQYNFGRHLNKENDQSF
jgi:hypothetical protein